MAPDLSVRSRTGATDLRFFAGSALLLLLATGATYYGLTHDDSVTALGAALLVPAAVLLAAIGVSGSGESRGRAS